MNDTTLARLQRRIKDLESLKIKSEYSKDDSSWHSERAQDDTYMRQSMDGGTTWGDAVSLGGSRRTGVIGTDSSTADDIVLFADSSGKYIKDSGKKLTDFMLSSVNPVPLVQTNEPNLDNLVNGGIYRLGDVTTGDAPSSLDLSNLLVLRVGTADTIAQMGIPYNNDEIYFRRGTTTNFTSNSWRRLWHDGNLVPIPSDGWISVTETWTRTGNYTFTMPGDLRGKYQPRDKFKITQDGTVKYGWIVKVTYASSTTTVYISQELGLTTSAISSKYISKVFDPQGFPYNTALLWTGGWSSGNLSVTGIQNFSKFLVQTYGNATQMNVDMMLGALYYYWRGMGGFVSTTPSIVTYHVGATLPLDGTETLTMENCRSVTHTSGSSHNSYTAQTVSAIYGVL